MTLTATATMPRLIGIAELATVTEPDRLRTVLGSCVGVALWDQRVKVAGLAHIILPSSAEGSGERGKFADTAIDDLVKMMRAAGAVRIRAKLAGGARMFGSGNQITLGERNIEATRERLRYHQIVTLAEHLGGTKGRKVTLDPVTGALEIQIIGEQATTI